MQIQKVNHPNFWAIMKEILILSNLKLLKLRIYDYIVCDNFLDLIYVTKDKNENVYLFTNYIETKQILESLKT